ncbi:hypothetical protein HD806DRAFT_449712 [Xylariaceae sp. AK1471]|nr:hypothetical protein HD806DRAFT_449712 [Xylariaceae sp. AK1471]
MDQPSKSSIGVELEFLLCIAEDGKPLNIPQMFESAKGGPLLLPAGIGRHDARVHTIVQRRLQQTVDSVLAEHRGTRVVRSAREVLLDANAMHLSPYRDWTIGSDQSFTLPPELAIQEHMNEFKWFSAEIASPALWATDASWDEIHAVVQAIANQYWFITPQGAGMHYHYGNGKDWIQFDRLRRIAAFLLAADPLLVQLHPEHRRDEAMCIGNRLYSRVAHGIPAAVTARNLGAQQVEQEPEFPVRTARPRPIPRPFRQRTPSLKVPFKRGQLTGYTFSQSQFNLTAADTERDADKEDGPKPLAIPYEVREILRCLNSPTVAELMRFGPVPGDRPAYSFWNYTFDLYRKFRTMSDGSARVFQDKRTLEFRQMASTMNPDEVVAHGKIIVRMCEWASEVDLETLWKVVLDCTVAENDGNWYDVFDLLAELDLVEEAKILQHAVARFRGETIPEDLDDDEEEDEEVVEARTRRRRSWLSWLTNWILRQPQPVN